MLLYPKRFLAATYLPLSCAAGKTIKDNGSINNWSS